MRRRSSSVCNKNLEEAREVFFAELRGGFRQRGTLIGSGGDQIGIRAADASDQKIAHVANRFAAEMLEVVAFVLESVNQSKRAVGGSGCDGFDKFVQESSGTTPSSSRTSLSVILSPQYARACSSSERASRRLPSAMRAMTATAPSAISRFSSFAMYLMRVGDFVEGERAKMKMLRARANGVVEIFRLGRGHDEDDAVGRFFESLEQSVRRFAGEHVRFVENHDFVARCGRSVANHFAQFANLVDAAIGGGVNFDDVERIARGDFLAGIAIAAGFGGGAVHAVQALARMRAVVVLPTPRAPEKM